MIRLATRVDDELASAIDVLVADGVYPSRSAAVRHALKELLRERRRQHDIEMYTRFPQTEEEFDWVDDPSDRILVTDSSKEPTKT